MDLRRAAGFTIIEMIIVSGTVAVRSTLAAPDLALFVKNNRAKGQAFHLVNTFRHARSEAAKSGVRPFLCREDPAQSDRERG